MGKNLLAVKSDEWLDSTKAFATFSAIDSAFICLFAWYIYSKLYYRLPMYIVIGIIFTAAYFILSAAVICWFGIRSLSVKNMLKIVVLAIPVFALSAILQWIYSFNFSDILPNAAPKEISSYVFIIDDSGSTEYTDPNLYRYIAVNSIMQDKDDSVQYMVYSFATNTICTREMTPKGDGDDKSPRRAWGATNIRSALRQAVTDYKQGKWNSAKSPEVILISDGYATDITSFYPLHTVLNDFVSAGIPISTIGFDDCDRGLLSLIADRTGGVFVDASSASGLFQAMRDVDASQIKEVPETRDLLSFRLSKNHPILYFIERVLFLSLIAIMVFRFAAIPCTSRDAPYYVVLLDYIKIVLFSILFELGTRFLSFPLLVFWFFFFIACFGFIALEEYEDE